MCGIFGLVNYGSSSYTKAGVFRKAISGLLKESELRGRDASGVCILTDSKAHMFKSNVRGSTLLNTTGYNDTIKHLNHTDHFRSVIGHTRLQTKGSKLFNVNNHPIVADRVIGVHNGVISNDDLLFDEYKGIIERAGRVDSEIIFRLVNYHMLTGRTIVESVKNTHDKLFGSYACAFINVHEPRYLTIFNNSHYMGVVLYVFEGVESMVFASTRDILNRALANNMALDPRYVSYSIEISTGGVRIDTETGKIYTFELDYSENSLGRYGGYRNIRDITRSSKKRRKEKARKRTAGNQRSNCNICSLGHSMMVGYGSAMMCSQCSLNKN